jgi:tRNA 2-thiocytidine biosynthesis protein TtcA
MMTELDRIKKRLLRKTGRAIGDFSMIEEGDRVMVCLSGGKDSFVLLTLLRELQGKAPVNFQLIAVHLDQHQPGFPAEVLPRYLESIQQEYHILREDTYSIVRSKIPEGKTTCFLCSRLRRGILYKAAVRLQCTKMALGHHADDLLETLLLNCFFEGVLKGMPPVLRSDDQRNVVIRPLVYCFESEIARLAELMDFPVIPCNLCAAQPNQHRRRMKRLIEELSKEFPRLRDSLLASLMHARPSTLMDRGLFDFSAVILGDRLSNSKKGKKGLQ